MRGVGPASPQAPVYENRCQRPLHCCVWAGALIPCMATLHRRAMRSGVHYIPYTVENILDVIKAQEARPDAELQQVDYAGRVCTVCLCVHCVCTWVRTTQVLALSARPIDKAGPQSTPSCHLHQCCICTCVDCGHCWGTADRRAGSVAN